MRKQKNDRLDAQLLLKLLVEDRFPRIWVPSPENRDLRQLLWHRHRLVQIRTRVAESVAGYAAMNEGVRRKGALWSKSGRAQLGPSCCYLGPADAGKTCWTCRPLEPHHR